ncbi:MAG: hypothetical protein GY711_19380 [bacterium]|nr:hypothetical protein [bacterium]
MSGAPQGYFRHETGLGDAYCATAANSTGSLAALGASGTTVAALNDFTLR